jgi:hypothetical protein
LCTKFCAAGQNSCYILILPAFGIISHTVETFSRKSIFGQDGPKNETFCFSQQAICRKVSVTYDVVDTFIVSRSSCADFVKIRFTKDNNPQETNAPAHTMPKSALQARLSTLVGSSEAIRLLLHYAALLGIAFYFLYTDLTNLLCAFFLPLTPDEERRRFNEWLGGLIDGDGCFLLSKKGYASLEIVMELRDKHCLYQIKQVFGGAVQLRAGDNHLRYRLHSHAPLLNLIAAVNGNIRNPVRLSQLHKICVEYDTPLLLPEPLTYRNGWFSGFFDSDGSVYLNLVSDQVFITVSQKNKLLLDILQGLYGGQIYPMRSVQAFKWCVYRKEEVIALRDDYFRNYPSRTPKDNRLKLLPKYFELKALKVHLASENSAEGKIWKRFLESWDRWGVD